MNSKYEIEKEDWEKFDADTKLWMIFNTFNDFREQVSDFKEETEKRFRRIDTNN